MAWEIKASSDKDDEHNRRAKGDIQTAMTAGGDKGRRNLSGGRFDSGGRLRLLEDRRIHESRRGVRRWRFLEEGRCAASLSCA